MVSKYNSISRYIAAWIVALSLVAGSLFPAPAAMAAQDLFTKACSSAADSAVCKSKDEGATRQSAADQVKTVINIILMFLGIIAVIMIVYGGFRYVLSNGDAGQIKTAKDTILYAVIGLIVAIMAFAIVNFFVSQLQGK